MIVCDEPSMESEMIINRQREKWASLIVLAGSDRKNQSVYKSYLL